MKIVVTGPHCSGKSTLLKRVESEMNYKEVKFVKFSGAECPIDYYRKSAIENESSEIDITLWMLSKMLCREIEVKYKLKNNENIVIFDRCVLDQLVYPMVNLKNFSTHIVIENFINLWTKNNKYDLIFYVPKNKDFLQKVNNFNQDINYLKSIEEMYLKVLEGHNDSFKKVIFLPESQDEQKEIIISTIKTLRNKRVSEVKNV